MRNFDGQKRLSLANKNSSPQNAKTKHKNENKNAKRTKTNRKQNMTPNRIGKLLKISHPDMNKHNKKQQKKIKQSKRAK